LSKLKNGLNRITLEYHEAIMHLASAIIVGIVFATGIGRYRIVLVYAVYFFLQAVFRFIKVNPRIVMFFLPAIAIALYFDVTEGPVLPLFTKNYLVIALPLMLALDTLTRTSIERLIQRFTEGLLFVVCPSCNYDNKELVNKCVYCSYKKGSSAMLLPTVTQTPYSKISPRVLKMLKLGDEQILFYLNECPSITFFINGNRDARANLIITTQNMIFLDYYRFAIRFPESWRAKDVVPLSDINRVELTTKKLYLAQYPFLSISTLSGDIYEMGFYINSKSKEKMEKIADILKEVNPAIEVIVNLPEPTKT